MIHLTTKEARDEFPDVTFGEGVLVSSSAEFLGRATVGDNAVISGEVKISHDVIIHDGVNIDASAGRVVIDQKTTIGKNTVIKDTVSISRNVRVGANVILSSCVEIKDNVSIDDYCYIGNATFIDTGARLLAGVHVGDEVYIGDLSTIKQRVMIHSFY